MGEEKQDEAHGHWNGGASYETQQHHPHQQQIITGDYRLFLQTQHSNQPVAAREQQQQQHQQLQEQYQLLPEVAKQEPQAQPQSQQANEQLQQDPNQLLAPMEHARRADRHLMPNSAENYSPNQPASAYNHHDQFWWRTNLAQYQYNHHEHSSQLNCSHHHLQHEPNHHLQQQQQQQPHHHHHHPDHQNGYLALQNGNNTHQGGLQSDDANQAGAQEAGENPLSVRWNYYHQHNSHHYPLAGSNNNNNPPFASSQVSSGLESEQHQIIQPHQQYTGSEGVSANNSTMGVSNIETTIQSCEQRYGDRNGVLDVINQGTSSCSSSSKSSATSSGSFVTSSSSSSSSSSLLSPSDPKLIDTNPINVGRIGSTQQRISNQTSGPKTTRKQPLKVLAPRVGRTGRAVGPPKTAPNRQPGNGRQTAYDDDNSNGRNGGSHTAGGGQSNSIHDGATYTDDDIVHTTTDITVFDRQKGRHVQITNEKLIVSTVKELNKLVSGFPRTTVLKVKQRRRTLKNRGYAQNCRQKRITQKGELEKSNQRLQEENERLMHEVVSLRRQLESFSLRGFGPMQMDQSG